MTIPLSTRVMERFDDNNFTALRLLLAVLVVFGHYRLFIGETSLPWPFGYAAIAVECFFVVSGYLITNSFDRDPDLKRFYIRRFFRIYPLYLAVVAAQTVALAVLAPGGIAANASALLRYFVVNATFANFLQHDVGGVLASLADPNLNPSLWTLKIEVGFYLILPAIWWAVRRFGVATLVLLFIASVVYFQVLDHAGNYRLAKQLPGQLQFFVVGIAAYLYRAKLPALTPLAGAALTLVLAVIVTVMARSHTPVLYPLAVGGLVTAAALYLPRVTLNTDISYGVYLLHAPVIQLSLVLGLYQPGLVGLSVALLVVLALAFIAERLIEAPGIALGKQLSRRPKMPSPVPPFPRGDVPQTLSVVILNDFCHVQGGASKVAIDEAVSLSRAGVDVTFLGAVGPVCQALKEAPLNVVCLDQHELLDVARHPAVMLQGLWNTAAARRMRSILQGLSRDNTVVHLHGYTKALSTSPVRMAERLGFQVVCTLHDFFSACPNGAFFDYEKGAPCPKRALSLSCMATSCDKRRYVHKLFRVARGVLQRWWGGFPTAVKHYISLSRHSSAILSTYLPPAARLHQLQNVIDVQPEAPVRVAQNRSIVCVGRLDSEKGVRLLADVVQQLGLAVTFVGDGPLRGEIERIPGISITGWLPGDQVKNVLANARCLVFPSLWYETYGLVVAEAAARGIPAIVSNISAAAERVEEGVTGWQFRSGDAADLARCLRLIDNDAVVEAAGLAAYRHFWANPETRDIHARHLVRIYKTALAG